MRYNFYEYSSAALSSPVESVQSSHTSTPQTQRRATNRNAKKAIHTKETNVQSLIIFEQVDIKRERIAYSVLVADIVHHRLLDARLLARDATNAPLKA
jgi:hypothetical protein